MGNRLPIIDHLITLKTIVTSPTELERLKLAARISMSIAMTLTTEIDGMFITMEESVEWMWTNHSSIISSSISAIALSSI
jgi:hypothetical protein